MLVIFKPESKNHWNWYYWEVYTRSIYCQSFGLIASLGKKLERAEKKFLKIEYSGSSLKGKSRNFSHLRQNLGFRNPWKFKTFFHKSRKFSIRKFLNLYTVFQLTELGIFIFVWCFIKILLSPVVTMTLPQCWVSKRAKSNINFF